MLQRSSEHYNKDKQVKENSDSTHEELEDDSSTKVKTLYCIVYNLYQNVYNQ